MTYRMAGPPSRRADSHTCSRRRSLLPHSLNLSRCHTPSPQRRGASSARPGKKCKQQSQSVLKEGFSGRFNVQATVWIMVGRPAYPQQSPKSPNCEGAFWSEWHLLLLLLSQPAFINRGSRLPGYLNKAYLCLEMDLMHLCIYMAPL